MKILFVCLFLLLPEILSAACTRNSVRRGGGKIWYLELNCKNEISLRGKVGDTGTATDMIQLMDHSVQWELYSGSSINRIKFEVNYTCKKPWLVTQCFIGKITFSVKRRPGLNIPPRAFKTYVYCNEALGRTLTSTFVSHLNGLYAEDDIEDIKIENYNFMQREACER